MLTTHTVNDGKAGVEGAGHILGQGCVGIAVDHVFKRQQNARRFRRERRQFIQRLGRVRRGVELVDRLVGGHLFAVEVEIERRRIAANLGAELVRALHRNYRFGEEGQELPGATRRFARTTGADQE